MDALQAIVPVDKWLTDKIEPLAPHYNIFQLDKPDEVGDAVTLPKPEVATIAKWLVDED